jgi:hypothetical protein
VKFDFSVAEAQCTHSSTTAKILTLVICSIPVPRWHRPAGFASLHLPTFAPKLEFAAELVRLLHPDQFAAPILCGIIPNVERINSLVDVMRLALLLNPCPTLQCDDRFNVHSDPKCR